MPELHGGQMLFSVAEFDSLYGRRRLADVDMDRPVWEIPGPRDAVVRWHEAGLITGPVLDAGCGAGSNALWLAGQGYGVTGFDGSASAVAQARSRAEAVGLTGIEFVQADAAALRLAGGYATVVDSALYHCLAEPARRAYLAGLRHACLPGARLLMICLSDALPRRLPGPFRITRDSLYETLPLEGWMIIGLRTGTITIGFTADLIRRAISAMGLPDLRDGDVEFTADGHALYPTWEVVAERRRV